jgi:hypothetical protein
MKDCGRPSYERCGECEACVAGGAAKEVMREVKKEAKSCLPSCFGLMALMMALCAMAGACMGLVYVGFKFVAGLFGEE